MRWDDFARAGSPAILGPAARGLSLGRDAFPPALARALSQAGVHVEEAAGPADLAAGLRERRPDVLILHAASLGPPGAAFDGLPGSQGGAPCPAILLCEERLVPEAGPAAAGFAELLGSGQDALGYFLMIRATLRRRRPHVMTEVLEFGRLSLDQEKFLLAFDGVETTLNKLEFCVLGAMLDAPRLVWNKVFLNRVVFGPHELKPGRQFDTYMSRVRRGIRARIGVDPIVSQHGMGYALSPPAVGGPVILPAAAG